MSRLRTEPETHQAVCDRCGWHTIPMVNKKAVQHLGKVHDGWCPAPPPPRNGARLACGCWTFKRAVPGCSVGETCECDLHGMTTFEAMNVPEPAARIETKEET
jgi:hypothetical protein